MNPWWLANNIKSLKAELEASGDAADAADAAAPESEAARAGMKRRGALHSAHAAAKLKSSNSATRGEELSMVLLLQSV